MNNIIETAEENILHTYNRYNIVLDHGDGVHVYDTAGKCYLDFYSGIGVYGLGNSNKEFNEALKNQIDKILICSTMSRQPKQLMHWLRYPEWIRYSSPIPVQKQ